MKRYELSEAEKQCLISMYYSFPNREVIDRELVMACRNQTCRGVNEITQFLKQFIKETYGIGAITDFSS